MLGDLQRGNYPPIVALFDMERSGAMLAWNFAHPDEPAPALIAAIQDRDLWRFELEHSKSLATLLRTVPDDVLSWVSLLELPFQQLVDRKPGDADLPREHRRGAGRQGRKRIHRRARRRAVQCSLHVRQRCRAPDARAIPGHDRNDLVGTAGGYRHVSLRSLDDRPTFRSSPRNMAVVATAMPPATASPSELIASMVRDGRRRPSPPPAFSFSRIPTWTICFRKARSS